MTQLLRFEEKLCRAVAAFQPSVRAELLEALVGADDERARMLGTLYQDGRLPVLAELLIDLEEDPAARALVVGELRRLSYEGGAHP